MKTLLALCAALFFLSSCKEPSGFKALPEGSIKHQLIVMARTEHGVRAKGFSQATPPKTKVFFEVGRQSQSIISNDDGSFDHELRGTGTEARGDLTFSIDAKHHQIGYEIKDLPQALARVGKKTFDNGIEIDHIALYDKTSALLSTNATLLSFHPIDETWGLKRKSLSTILLNPEHQQQLYPRASLLTKNHAIVALYGTHELLLIDRASNNMLYKSRLLDQNGKLYLFENNPSLAVKNPSAWDGTNASLNITKSFAHSPEALFAIDDTNFLVAFANYYQFADASKGHASVVGPSIIALMSIENNQLRTKQILQLPFKNPRYFMKNNDAIWVSASGVYRDINSQPVTSDEAGLVKLAFGADKSLSIAHTIPLPNFSPAEPALINNKIIIPLAYGNSIVVIDGDATAVNPQDIKTPNFPQTFAFTVAAHWHDDIFFLTSTDGSLVAYSLTESFFPFPFIEPIRINQRQGKLITPSPTQLIFQKAETNEDYSPGFSAWVLSSTQNKVFLLDFLEVFGT